MGEFDKIIKENIEAIFVPLLEKLLGIQIVQSSELKDKIQRTIEREPDYLKQVTDSTGATFILQLEFQTTDDARMVYRMAEYKAILQRKYEVPVRQFVIYLGSSPSRMSTELKEEEKITGFVLKNIHDLSTNEVLNSDIPEEVMLSILTDYPQVDAAKVINKIVIKLRETATSPAELERYIQQLMVLSRLRNLDEEIERQIKTMPITYDITKDRLYNQGIKKGIKKGIEKGIEEKTYQMIAGLIKQDILTIEQIAEVAKVSVDQVIQIRKELYGK